MFRCVQGLSYKELVGDLMFCIFHIVLLSIEDLDLVLGQMYA
jgi:hypothetical protein